MADDFDPLMNPAPDAPAPAPKPHSAPATAPAPAAAPARASVPLHAPAPSFAPPRPPPASNMFDNLDDDDDGLLLAAPAPSPARPRPAPAGPAAAADNVQQAATDSAPAAAAARAPRPAAARTVDACSSNASQFTGVTRRGSNLFHGADSDVVLGGAADVFIPSEARGLETGAGEGIAVEALDDDLLRVHDDDIDSLFAEEPAAALPGRKDRLGLAQPAASAVGNRSAGSAALFGARAKVSAAPVAAAPNDDDDDDLFGDLGGTAASDTAANVMSGLNLQEYIAKQKSRCDRLSPHPAPPHAASAAAHQAASSTDAVAATAACPRSSPFACAQQRLLRQPP
jgi:hypothetical protein